MKAELQAKYIQFLNNKKNSASDKGFTLIELLVVVIIIGVLSAIALPSFLNQAAKAKQSEAKTTITSVNGAQATRKQTGGSFATNMSSLSLGLPDKSANYSFVISSVGDTAQILSTNVDTSLKNYTGGNTAFLDGASAPVTATILCESKTAGANTGLAPTLDSTKRTLAEAAVCNTAQDQL